jgi:MFS family permease
MAALGWRLVFLLFGAVSLLWLPAWIAANRGAQAVPRDETPAEPSPAILLMLQRREMWGAALGHFAATYPFYFIMSWLPLYLVKARGFSVSEMAVVGGAVYLAFAAAALASGWLSDAWMSAGASTNRVRTILIASGHLGVAAGLLACAAPGHWISLVALFVSAGFCGAVNPQVFAIGQCLAGPGVAGKWMGIQNCVGNLSGIVGPIITGVIIDRMGGFEGAFVLSAAVSLAGIMGWAVMIPKVAPINWRTTLAE